MDDRYESRDLRSRLITAGIAEIEAHGVADFSLRRVASACGASCAAPYRHFENKSTFILEIIKYINSRWELFQEQIEQVCSDDTKHLVVELSMALIRFRLANPEFRAVLTIDKNSLDENQRSQMSQMTAKIIKYTQQYCRANCPEKIDEKSYLIQSMIYGAVLLCDNDSFTDREASLEMVKRCMESCLTQGANNDV